MNDGVKFEGAIFVANIKKFEGELEATKHKLITVDSAEEFIINYVDVASEDGDICAVKIRDLEIDPEVLKANPDKEFEIRSCLEIETKSHSLVTICIDPSDNDGRAKMLKLGHKIRK